MFKILEMQSSQICNGRIKCNGNTLQKYISVTSYCDEYVSPPLLVQSVNYNLALVPIAIQFQHGNGAGVRLHCHHNKGGTKGHYFAINLFNNVIFNSNHHKTLVITQAVRLTRGKYV